jgi:hypothetical protein
MPQRKKPALPPLEPWKPTPWEIEDAGAIQALERGAAEPHQQQRALKYIVEMLSGYYEISFKSGPDGDRMTAFSEGKRYVGKELVKLMRVNLAKFKDGPSEQG